MRNPIHFLILLVLLSAPVQAEELRVAVTSSFHPTLLVLESRLERLTETRIEISSAATGTLYQQIEHGAPFDLFLAADGKHPERLVRDGLAIAASQRPYARGQLVLAGGPPGRPPGATAVLIPRQRIAIPNPLAAPYGQAAQDWLRRMRFWDEVRPRLVVASNVSQAVQMVEAATVDLAFTALPVAQKMQRTAFMVIPPPDYPPILHQAVVLKGGSNPAAAQQLLDTLLSDEIQAEIIALGYLPLPGPVAGE